MIHFSKITAILASLIIPMSGFSVLQSQNVDFTQYTGQIKFHPDGEKSEIGTTNQPNTYSLSVINSEAKKASGIYRTPTEIKTGLYFGKDAIAGGKYSGASLTVSKDPETGKVVISNINGLGNSAQIYGSYTPSTGTVSFQCQEVAKDPFFGDIYLVPIVIEKKSDGTIDNITYSFSGRIRGTVTDDNVITLGSWGLVYKGADESQSKAIQFFESSVWSPASIIATAYDVKNDKNVTYALGIEQTSETTADIYGLSGLYNDVLHARLNPDNTIEIGPQQVYNNLLLGVFYIYPCDIKADGKVSVDITKSLVGSATGENKINFTSWLIGANNNPTGVIGSIYKDITISGNHGLKFPDKTELSFKGEGTQQSPYLISSLNHLTDLASLVKNGNSFNGKYFSLTSDIDMSSAGGLKYVPVGTATTPFEGVFNGNNKTLSGLETDDMGLGYMGLFGVVGSNGKIYDININGFHFTNYGNYTGIIAGLCQGNITGCNITSSSVVSRGQMAGGITGCLNGNGAIISGCSFTGSVRGMGSIGGIAGQASGTISSCNVRGNFTHNGFLSENAHDIAAGVGVLVKGKMTDCQVSGTVSDSFGMANSAGLIARLKDSEIARCFTVAAVIGKRNAAAENDYYCGGLLAYSSNSRVTDCFSAGTVRKNESSENVGGLVGYLGVSYSYSTEYGSSMDNLTIFTNCYSSSQIISSSTNAHKGIWGATYNSTSWTGIAPDEACFKNCFFDNQVNFYNDNKYGVPTSYLTSGNLPEGFDSSIWETVSGSYPVLKSLKGSSATALASSPLLLGDNTSVTKVKGYATYTPVNGVTWKIMDGSSMTDESSSLKHENGRFVVKDIYALAVVSAVSSDGWGAKLYNISVVPAVFSGDGSEKNPYLISSVEDWKKLDYAVTKIGQPHDSDYFAMTSDIDFNYDTDFSGLGFGRGKAAAFGGRFDGRGHTISRLRINAVKCDEQGLADTKSSVSYTGLFGIINENGSVSNLNFAADCKFDHFTYGGAIAGANLGVITNCRNYADATSVGNYAGGLVGLNVNVIQDCYNSGNIYQGASCAGGIAGFVNPEAKIVRCQNDGDIIGKEVNPANATSKRSAFGGITGTTCGLIENCVNHGLISALSSVGGIAGVANNQFGSSIIRGCINIGMQQTDEPTVDRGAIVGLTVSNSIQTGNVYDSSINLYGSTNNVAQKTDFGLSTSTLVSGEPVAELSSEIFDFKADAYPVLKRFADEKAASALRVIFAKFQDNQLRTNIRTSVPLSAASGLTFTLRDNTGFSVSGNSLNVNPPTGNNVLSDVLTAKLGEYSKTLAISSIPSILSGDGTSTSPYLINTPEDWNKLAEFMEESTWEFPGDFFSIEKDLDFNGGKIKALGVNGVRFMGNLAGNNKTIKNYVYVNSNDNKNTPTGENKYQGLNIGLIGALGSNATVKDLTINGSFKGYANIGGMVGLNYGTVENINHAGTIETTGAGNASGIVFYSYPDSKIINCKNTGKVISASSNASGIAYEIANDAELKDCENSGIVSAAKYSAGGIAINNYGTISSSHNHGELKSSTGRLGGIIVTLGTTGTLENCSNTSDIDMMTDGSYISGIFMESAGDVNNPSKAVVKGCFNTGDIYGKTQIFGIGGNIAPGMTISDCYNTGDLLATGTRGLVAGVSGLSGKGDESSFSRIERCYNLGEIKGTASKCAGIVSDANIFTHITDCYNFGDITSTDHTDIGLGGIAGRGSGTIIENCFNAGDISSSGNAVGGIAGYVSTTGTNDKVGAVINCYNIGNVTSSYTGIQTQGNAGGILGYISAGPVKMTECFNMGNIKSSKLIGGLAGGILDATSSVTRCYNAGKVTCTGSNPASWSGTVMLKGLTTTVNGQPMRFDANSSDVYYDVTVNPGSGALQFEGSAKTTSEISALDLGENYVKHASGGYPALKLFNKFFDHENISHSMIVLTTPQENFDMVTDPFKLISPDNAVWTATDPATGAATALLQIKDNIAVPVADGSVVLTVSDSKGLQSKQFILELKPSMSSVDDVIFPEDVVETQYFDLAGKQIYNPTKGDIYIVRYLLNDGRTINRKIVF